jgi:diadenosine tetraphosphate (Ap4A) HIT family hydrolase
MSAPAPDKVPGCPMCSGAVGDAGFFREQVWEDERWRLTTSSGPGDPTAGFSYLEPKRHIPHITDLDGEEAATFGPVLARCAAALKEASGAELVYLYVFGDSIPHLHVHLAPHRDGDALVGVPIRGEFEEQKLENGATGLVSTEFPSVPTAELRRVVDRVRQLLG